MNEGKLYNRIKEYAKNSKDLRKELKTRLGIEGK